MKKIKKFAGIAATLCLTLATALFAACGGTSSAGGSQGEKDSAADSTGNTSNGSVSSGSESTGGNSSVAKQYYTVTFDTNGGSAVESQTVEAGLKATKPEDPTKNDYIFGGWWKDQVLETAYDFTTEVVTSNITIYASWENAANTSTAKFYWNYDGAPDEGVFATKIFATGGRISDPGSPVRTGYAFGGWYSQDGKISYSAMKKYDGNQEFYAKWQQIYTFEAENTQLTGLTDDFDLGLATESGAKIGYNFSGSANGVNLVKSDSRASSGSYVSGLFYRGAYLQFEITSDRALSGAVLRLVASCEYADISLNSNTYKISVNGTNLKFSDFSLGNGTSSSTDPGPRGGFKEIFISNIDLNEGKNIIRLTVNNSQTPAGEAGTVDAAAPAVDCIKIYADATLTMMTYENK